MATFASFSPFECSVCYSVYDTTVFAPKTLLCGHTFCLSCLLRQETAERETSPSSRRSRTITCLVCRKVSAARPQDIATTFALVPEKPAVTRPKPFATISPLVECKVYDSSVHSQPKKSLPAPTITAAITPTSKSSPTLQSRPSIAISSESKAESSSHRPVPVTARPTLDEILSAKLFEIEELASAEQVEDIVDILGASGNERILDREVLEVLGRQRMIDFLFRSKRQSDTCCQRVSLLLIRYRNDPEMCELCFKVISLLARKNCHKVKLQDVSSEFPNILSDHDDDEGMCIEACIAIKAMATGKNANPQVMVDATLALQGVLENFTGNDNVTRVACSALDELLRYRSLLEVARSDGLLQVLLDLREDGAEFQELENVIHWFY